jgi:hypothetical protein
MKKRTDFAMAFQNGHSMRYDSPYYGTCRVTFSVHNIGHLILTSGRTRACDPLLEPETRDYFAKRVTPGRYPVILSIAEFKPREERRVAAAMLRLSRKVAIRWRIATVNGRKEYQGKERYSYPVDSGTGGFMDLDAARVLSELVEADYLDNCVVDRFEENYCARVCDELVGNEGLWANVQVDQNTKANVIAFASGWGDGGYVSYWGYDAEGNTCSLVTDFALFCTD